MVKKQDRENLLKLGEWFLKIPIEDRKRFRKSVLEKIEGEKAITGANEFFDELEAAC